MAVLSYDGTKSYVGRVLREREYNGYHDSDFYAQVVTEAGTVMEVEFATTRGGCGKAFGTYLDATDEALDAAEAYWRGTAYESHKTASEAAAKWPSKGKTVRLTRAYRSKKLGVTLSEGSEGTVFWVGEDRYQDRRMTFRAYRVGVEFAEGKVFLAAGTKGHDGMLSYGDVETVGWESEVASESELREKAAATARGRRAEYERNYGARYAEGRERNAREAAEAVAA